MSTNLNHRSKKVICHVSSAHPAEDVRIFHKECSSLSAAGYKTFLIVQAPGNYTKNGVDIKALKYLKSGRIYRMIDGVNMALIEALKVKADVYHLHDPELLRIVSKLKKTGAKVLFDAHEDTVKQILSKPYLSNLSRLIVSRIYSQIEVFFLRNVDAVVTATDAIKTKFERLGKLSECVSNYPMLHEFSEPSNKVLKTKNSVCYAGSISLIRGSLEIIGLAKTLPNVNFRLAGPLSDEESRKAIEEAEKLPNFHYEGLLSREKVIELYAMSQIGLLPFHKVPNHLDAVPNKMYEYMAAELPVLAMDMELWRGVIEKSNSGLMINFLDIQNSAKTIESLLNDPERILEMGKNGRNQILKTYNWTSESQKLLHFYSKIVP